MVYCTGGRPEKVSSFRGVSCPSCSCPSYRSRINERPFASRRAVANKKSNLWHWFHTKPPHQGRNVDARDAMLWPRGQLTLNMFSECELACTKRTCKDECVVEIRVFFLHPTSWKNACVHFTTWLRARHFHLTFLREMRGSRDTVLEHCRYCQMFLYFPIEFKRHGIYIIIYRF